MKIILQIIIRELQRLRKRPAAWVLLLVIPIGIFFYLGAIYEKGAIENVPIAILDLDHSDLSRTVINNVEASPKLSIVKFLNTHDNIDEIFIKYPEIKGFYVIPKNFQKNIFKGQQENILVYSNSSNIIYGNLIYKEAATFINTMSAGINLKNFKLSGIPKEKAMKIAMPIRVIAKPMYNPYYNYLYYLIPGLTTVLLQMIVFFLAARSINSEYTDNTFNELLSFSNGSIFKIVIGKLLTYTLLGFMIAVFIFSMVHPLLGIPTSKGTLSFLWVVIVFVLANAMLGIMISTIFKNEAIAMDISFVYNSPAFVFSGFTFPIIAMPAFNAWYAQLIPYTHFLSAFIKGVEMNTPFSFLIQPIIYLLLFFLTGYIITITILIFQNKKIEV
ncbi:ABC transporter permease [Joostella atrarenae]|uniref:ABC transporter permease n=1 Tax=Joostella atrarenae TaxID=679257 RepID=A0ABS9J260_9FLAO|nr:ABC transporter permease [Joostella atrarenae]MCF8714435.1 ABC transporter permease [Joostella atrarenae]